MYTKICVFYDTPVEKFWPTSIPLPLKVNDTEPIPILIQYI